MPRRLAARGGSWRATSSRTSPRSSSSARTSSAARASAPRAGVWVRGRPRRPRERPPPTHLDVVLAYEPALNPELVLHTDTQALWGTLDSSVAACRTACSLAAATSTHLRPCRGFPTSPVRAQEYRLEGSRRHFTQRGLGHGRKMPDLVARSFPSRRQRPTRRLRPCAGSQATTRLAILRPAARRTISRAGSPWTQTTVSTGLTRREPRRRHPRELLSRPRWPPRRFR